MNNEINELKAELVMTAHKSPIKALAMSKYRVDCTGEEAEEEEQNDEININDEISEQQQLQQKSSPPPHQNNQPKIYLMESLVSVDEAGELAVWNCRDGRCLLHNLRATGTGKSSAGYPNSISISPNYEFCILAGFTDKLVVVRLSTLEIVQIVDVAGGLVPRWTRSSGFLLQDDPNLLLDFLTLNFNGPVGESLTARQFDPKAGKFVSPACPILPQTIPSNQICEFASCHLLTCSRANPGLAALVTKLQKVWLIDFLSGEFVNFSLDFDIDGVEFVRADLLLVWSNTGKISFYSVFIQSPPPKIDSQASLDDSSQQSRSKSPLSGHVVVRKLDFKCSFPFGNNRLHIKLLAGPAESDLNFSCASLLCIETIHCPQRRTQVSLVKVEFDRECPDRTVHLIRETDKALPLILSDTTSENSHNKKHQFYDSFSPITCTITALPHWLIHGHVDGRISRKCLVNFFSDSLTGDKTSITPLLEDVQMSFISAPITSMAAFNSSQTDILVIAGDSQGQLQFWNFSDNSFVSLGASRCHVKKIVGITECDGAVYSWSSDGLVAMYRKDQKDLFRCVHLFYPPTNSLGLAGLYWQVSNGNASIATSPTALSTANSTATTSINTPTTPRASLLLDYRAVNSPNTIVHSHWNLLEGCKMADLTDSDYLETLSISNLKIQIEGLCDGLAVAGGRSIQPYRSVENSQLFDGVIAVLGDGRQWPELPCHTLMIDIRLLVKKLQQDKPSVQLVKLAKLVLSQFLAWGVSDRMDAICENYLHLSPNSHCIRTGLLGANGNVSLILNPRSKDRFWTLSPTLTASLQLSIVLLLASIPWDEEQLDKDKDDGNLKQNIATLVSFYSAKIGDIPGGCTDVFRPAALSFISKFWQDPEPEIQKAARILFSSTLARLTPSTQSSLISYWKDYLPNGKSSGDGRSMYRSAIILGIIGVQEPDTLSKSIKKHVAESLVALLLDGKRNIFRLSAVELIGRGYLIWLPFIHGASIFKLLHSWLIQLYGGDEQFYSTTLRAILYILTANESNASPQEQFTTTFTDSLSTLNSALSHSAASSRKTSSSSASSVIFSQSSPFQGWISDLLSSLQGSREVSVIERKCSLDLIRNLLDFKPLIFQQNEAILVEITIKLAEGNSLIFQELDNHFGLISFHQRSNRIAVALQETPQPSSQPQNETIKSIAVFDTKTGNRVALLQGHLHPCTLVAFNQGRQDGKQLLSYSEQEASIRWWNTSAPSSSGTTSSIGSLFSSFASASSHHHESSSDSARPGAKPVKVVIVQPELTEAINCIPDGSVFKLNPINLTWIPQNKSVEFRVGASLVQTLSIPN
jgi:hypothetical protein